MPKGTRGCFACGAPTARVVQVTLRDVDWKHPVKGRERTVDAVQRAFCEPCARVIYATITRVLHRPEGQTRGCAQCGTSPCRSRIQIWVRAIGEMDSVTGIRAQRGVPGAPAKATSYCEECRDGVYDAATDPLDGGNWNMTDDASQHRGDMSGARAVRASRRSAAA